MPNVLNWSNTQYTSCVIDHMTRSTTANISVTLYKSTTKLVNHSLEDNKLLSYPVFHLHISSYKFILKQQNNYIKF